MDEDLRHDEHRAIVADQMARKIKELEELVDCYPKTEAKRQMVIKLIEFTQWCKVATEEL